MTPDRVQVNGVLGAVEKAVVTLIEEEFAKAPAEIQPALEPIKNEIVLAINGLAPDLVGQVLDGLKNAVLTGDFGPATSSPADLA